MQLKGIKRMAESLLMYSHRHYDRLSRLLQVNGGGAGGGGGG